MKQASLDGSTMRARVGEAISQINRELDAGAQGATAGCDYGAIWTLADGIATDEEAPPAVRGRARLVCGIVDALGDKVDRQGLCANVDRGTVASLRAATREMRRGLGRAA